jgi:ubiquinone/menaquinone biosynthesis C-methylase UbiE/radical SAM superfamily enzyme YgiQ (UPF0313 family)
MIGDKMTKVLLWNSTLGKVYSTSDGFLDNGLALLKAACEDNGILVVVEDPADIDFMDNFVKTDLPDQKDRFGYTSTELSILLNNLAPDVFTPTIPDSEKTELKKKWDDLQEVLSAVTEEKMERYLDELVEKVIQEKIDIVGMKTWLGKRFTCTERFAEKLKTASPETFIIAGGPQINNFHEEALVGNEIDLAVYLEGEKTLVQVSELIRKSKESGLKKNAIMEVIVEEARKGGIPNLIYRDNGQIKKSDKNLMPMTEKPMPKYDFSPGKVNIAVVEDELGCYYRKGCALCGHDNAMGGYRTQKIDHLIAQIRELICQDVGLFRLSSSATSSAKGAKIARRILEEGINLEFSMFTRAENNAEARYGKLIERYEAMIEAGLKAIFLGVEAANQEVLDHAMEKGNAVDDMFYTVLALKESAKKMSRHVDVGLSFIYPAPLLPDSTVTQEVLLEDNIDFLRRLEDRGCKADSVLITPSCPLPGSRWLTEKDKFGFEVPDDFLQVWLRYNYELAKDPKTWPDVPVHLNGKPWKEMVELTSTMGKRLYEAGYAINLTDEHCLSARASGMLGKWGLVDFKARSDYAIFSTYYPYLVDNYRTVNDYSRSIARSNRFHPRFEAVPPITYAYSKKPSERILEPEEAMAEHVEVMEYEQMVAGLTHHIVINKPFIKEAVNLGVTEGKVLDVGCGEGTIASMLFKENKSYEVYGVDLSETMIRKAKELNQREGIGGLINYDVGDVARLPYHDGYFDLVVCNHLFHHLPDKTKMLEVLKEIQRVTKDDGAIFIKDVCRPENEEKRTEYAAKFGTVYPEGLQKEIYLNSIQAGMNFQEWKELMSDSGLLSGLGVELKVVYILDCPTHLVVVKRRLNEE